MKPSLIIIRGLPGSGKSTLAQAIFNLLCVSPLDVAMVSADDFFMVDGVYKYDRERIGEAHRQCRECVEDFLGKNYTVIVHNTFCKLWEMEPYLNLAASLNVDLQVIETKGPWKNVHGCPDEKVEEMRRKWEPYDG